MLRVENHTAFKPFVKALETFFSTRLNFSVMARKRSGGHCATSPVTIGFDEGRTIEISTRESSAPLRSRQALHRQELLMRLLRLFLGVATLLTALSQACFATEVRSKGLPQHEQDAHRHDDEHDDMLG